MKKILSALIGIVFMVNISAVTYADKNYDIEDILSDTAECVYQNTGNPQVSSIGGEWAVIGLARSETRLSDNFYERYYENLKNKLTGNKGILDERKYTEYSRVILALTAIGINPSDVSGYNLLSPLADFEKTIFQGINGAVWALLALDSGNYEIPYAIEGTQATREAYVNLLINKQLADGGWALSGEKSDPDVTAMVLQALANYRRETAVENSIENALAYLSSVQNENGGFESDMGENAESAAQVIIALATLGIPIDSSMFVKNGKNALDSLLSYYLPCDGFKHNSESDGANQMATEQALCALTALYRFENSRKGIYEMSDAAVLITAENEKNTAGGDVNRTDIIFEGKTFPDIEGHINQKQIEALAERGIINGRSETEFAPDLNMSRAEFAVILTMGLGLEQSCGTAFDDVGENDWFYDYINTAYSYGIIKGVSENEFNPNGIITREQAAVMIANAAVLCGLNTVMEYDAARDILAGFSDYTSASGWAFKSLACCCNLGILSNGELEIRPKEAVTRAEIANMLFNLMEISGLIYGVNK